MSIEFGDINRFLDSICSELQICASIWGSFLREEQTPLSDIDIICYCGQKTNIDSLKCLLEESLSNYLHHQHQLDIAFINGSAYDYALINGTNFHSVYFSDSIVGDKSLSLRFEIERERLRSKSDFVIREFFNLFTSYFGLANVLNTNDSRFTKFSLNGTNKWVRLVQAAQLRWHNLIGKTSKEVLVFLSQKYHADVTQLLEAYELDFNYRIEIEKGERIKQNTTSFTIWHNLFQSFVLDSIPWIQSGTGVSANLFHRFCKIMKINDADIPSPRSINPYAEAVIISFMTKNPQQFESILSRYNHNWWVMTNLCVNDSVPPEVLERIVFPDFNVDPIVWKSVRLYVAKNKNTSIQTLQKILHTEGLREQDYLAARNNLDSRKRIL